MSEWVRYVCRILPAFALASVASFNALLASSGAADGPNTLAITFAPGDRFSLAIRANVKIAATITSPDQRTAIVSVVGASLPSGFPNYQSIGDPLVASLSAAQTALQPPAATLALTMRANAAARMETSSDGMTITVIVSPTASSAAASLATATPLPATAPPSPAAFPSVLPPSAYVPHTAPMRTPARRETAVVPLDNADIDPTIAALRPLFPQARIMRARGARAMLVVGSASDVAALRTVAEALDAQSGSRRATDAVPLRTPRGAQTFAAIARRAFPDAMFASAPNNVVVVIANANELAAVRAFLGTLDAAAPTPGIPTSEVLRITHASSRDIAAALRPAYADVRFTAGNGTLVIAGPAGSVERAKSVAQSLDVPAVAAAQAQVYKMHASSATDVSGVLHTAFPGVPITADAATNSIVVRASDTLQAQIAQALATLDVVPQPGGGGTTTEVVQVANAVPGTGAAASTSTTDIASALTAILGPNAPDLRVIVPANSTLLAISGSPQTVRAALDILKKIDVPIAQIVLDTAVYEVSETGARNLGLQLGTPVLSTVFSEVQPQAGSFATAAPFLGLQQLTRTPLSLQAQLNILISSGQGRVLADPRIATISGRTATIRAGDNIPYVQQGSGALGAVTSTVLTFSTGVTLDITPIANPDGRISVNIHPIINTETGVTSQQVPQISSREAQTTVNLRDGETVIIGGLIQESDLDANNKIPLLGDLPLIGGAFRNKDASRSRNELIILVTPHLVAPDGSLDRTRPIDMQSNRLAPVASPTP